MICVNHDNLRSIRLYKNPADSLILQLFIKNDLPV